MKYQKQKLNNGGKNLMILGFGAILFALVTTIISLVIYHNSGDIYLDRSRPGYLPDEEEMEKEVKDEEELNYSFDKSGELTAETLDAYLEKLKVETDAMDANGDAFSMKVLLDEELGIPSD